MTESQAPPEAQINDGDALAVADTSTEKVGSKRQRRPSVRLGDLGGDHALDSLTLSRRFTKPHQHTTINNKSSKNRSQFIETLDGGDADLDSVAIGSWKVRDSKSKRTTSTKRIRSNWTSKLDDDVGGPHGEEMDKSRDGGSEDIDEEEDEDEDEEGFKEFDSDSPPVKEKTKNNNSSESGRVGGGVYRRRISTNSKARVVELDNDVDSDSERDGVRVWLNQLGLGRYAPVFEVHEVDDEVLPMLTLEDLKDMGINAVGSRRKMYASIHKLGKGFS